MKSVPAQSRLKMLWTFVIIMMIVFALRLFYLQVVKHDFYVAQAQEEQTRKWDLPAVRGEIYMLDGEDPVKVVMNQTVYTVAADPQVIEDPAKVKQVITDVAGGTASDNIDELLAKKDTRYQVIAKEVTYKQAEKIKAENLYGIMFIRADKRVYPEGKLGSQVLGFVNGEGEGQYGIEGKLNTELRGVDGRIKTVTDVRDVPLTIGKDNINIPAKDGEKVVLSIDRTVQNYAEEVITKHTKKLGYEKGSLIVMDPSTGQVKAMANYPTFDPAKYSEVKDVALFNNRSISHVYEPASVIKSLMYSTAINEGAISPETTYVNTDHVTLGGITIGNATEGQTGSITMQHALSYSLNTGSVFAAQQLGGGSINAKARQIIYKYYHDRFRLGEKTDIELAGEAKGEVISPDRQEGNEARYATMTFGQGLYATPIQVAAAFDSVINGGKYIAPSVLAGTMSGDEMVAKTPNASTQVLTGATSSTMRTMLETVRSAFYDAGDKKGYAIGSKTGTAQTVKGGAYTFDQTEGTMVGFGGEKGKMPKYVILVTYESPNAKIFGSYANPAFTEMSNKLIDYYNLQPKG